MSTKRAERIISDILQGGLLQRPIVRSALEGDTGFDGAFVFADQFGDNFDLPLDLRMKMLNTRTAPGHGPRPLCCSATQEVGSGSDELGPGRP